jgi:Domain of unknown function (DUF4337)
MSHGPEHQIEHAEHAAHAAGDAFNRVVTMSIAIVAAFLACVTMLGHRAHNDTLRLQGEALELQTKASIQSTETANKWAYYQTKNMFNLESEIMSDMLEVMTTRDDRKPQYDAAVKRYRKNVNEYKGTGKSEGEKVENEGKLQAIKRDAEEKEAKTKKLMEESQERLDKSHIAHEKGERFDVGELGLQFGVVLCSLAILTKSRGFWIAGLISSALGAAVAISGQLELFIGHH